MNAAQAHTVNNWAQVALPRMAILLHEAQYPEHITLLAGTYATVCANKVAAGGGQ